MWRTTLLIVTVCSFVLMPAVGQDHADGLTQRGPGEPVNFRGLVEERGQSLEKASFLRISKSTTDYRLGQGDVIRIEIVNNAMAVLGPILASCG